MKTGLLVVASVLLALVVGCGKSGGSASTSGGSVPKEAEGRAAVEKQMLENNKDRLKLLSFQKTNGQSSTEDGVAHYKLEFQCEVEVTKDCFWFFNRPTEPKAAIRFQHPAIRRRL